MKEKRIIVNEQKQLKRIALYSDRSYLWRLVAVLIFCSLSAIGAGYLVVRAGENILWILFCGAFLCASLLGLTGLMIYSVRLIFEKGPVLVFDEVGALDFSSILSLGRVPLAEIKSLQLRESWIQDLLVIKLRKDSETWAMATKRSAWRRAYAHLFSATTYVPLDVLLVEKHNMIKFVNILKRVLIGELVMESGFEDLSSSYKEEKKWDSDGNKKKSLPKSASKKENKFLDQVEESATSSHFKSKILKAKLKSILEQDSVVEKVEKIRKAVESSKFDRLICDLYHDDVRQFPIWLREGKGRLPQGVGNPQQKHQGLLIEAIVFEYGGHKIGFSIARSDKTLTTDALLNVTFNEKEVCTIKVKVEIGELAPQSLVRFIQGPWQEELSLLAKACERARQGNFALQGEISQVVEDTEITSELRKNFGIDEE